VYQAFDSYSVLSQVEVQGWSVGAGVGHGPGLGSALKTNVKFERSTTKSSHVFNVAAIKLLFTRRT